MLSFESFIAKRYLTTQRKGAFVKIMRRFAVSGIALGVSSMVLCMALMNGFREEIQNNLFSASAHFQVMPILGDLDNLDQTLSIIRSTPGVKAASAARLEKGLIRSSIGDLSPEPIIIKGIDPNSAGSTSTIFSTLKDTTIEALTPGRIFVGNDLAKRLNLRPGSDVSIAFFKLDAKGTSAEPQIGDYRVAGIFESNIGEFDRNWVFFNLKDAMRIARTQRPEMIDVRTISTDEISTIKSAVLEKLGGSFVATDLRETNKPLFAALKVEKWIFTTLLSIIVCIAIFNIVASLVLLVTEKKKDLGVLLALGATPKQIETIFTRQGIHMGITGTLWGLGISIPFCLLADRYQWIHLPAAVYDFITYVPFRLYGTDILIATLFPLAIALLASRYPARMAAKLDPIHSMRSL